MLVFTYGQVMASLKLPDYMAEIVNNGVVLGDQDIILKNGGLMLLVAMAGAICTILVIFLAARVGTAFAREMRESVFRKVESFSLQEFNHFSTASLITRTTNDIQQVQQVLIMVFRMVLAAPITGIGAVMKAFDIAPDMTWIMGLGVAVLLTVVSTVFIFAVPKYTLLQKLVDKLNLVTREKLEGVRVIRAFTAQKFEESKFDKVNKDLTKTNLFVNRLMVVMQPVMMLIFNVIIILVVWIGAKLVGDQLLQIGEMIAFMQYAMQLIMAFLMMSIVFIMLPRAVVSIKRIAEVLNTKPVITDPEDSTDNQIKGLVRFENVTFSYPKSDEPVLKNISFEAIPGTTVAIVGGTGSGKSTLVNLIPRFFDVSSGNVLIDNINIKKYSQKELRKQIGYVPQNGILFSGSIVDNISFGNKKLSQDDVIEFATTAQAVEFIEKLENKYDTAISQGGKNVSGGQKQRLAIARALAVNPKIYIFDDSFSALDFKTDKALRKALRDKTGNATVFIVAQRVGTVMNADQILVLDKGELVCKGTHRELLKNCAVYREIASSQLSEEELSYEE